MASDEVVMDARIPQGYAVRLVKIGRAQFYQPLRDWGGGVNIRLEALYRDEELDPVTYKTLPGAIKFAQRAAALHALPVAEPVAEPVTDESPFDASGLTPEQRMRNVAQVVMEATTVTRNHNGRGRPPTYAARVDAIADAARQLAEMVLASLDE